MLHLLIDGYNLLPFTDCSSRESFVQALVQYHQRKKFLLTVVFDGTYKGKGKEEHLHTGGIHIIFSPLTVQADEVIENLLLSLKNEEVLVVSSDRRIQKAAEQSHKAFLSSPDFAKKLQNPSPRIFQPNPNLKPIWLEGREEESQEKPSQSKASNQKLSKKEKARRKMLTRL